MLLLFLLWENFCKDRRRESRRRALPRCARPSPLLRLDALALDDRAVALLLLAHEGRHLVRRAGNGIQAEREIALLDVGRLRDLLHLGRQTVERFAWRPRRRCIA